MNSHERELVPGSGLWLVGEPDNQRLRIAITQPQLDNYTGLFNALRQQVQGIFLQLKRKITPSEGGSSEAITTEEKVSRMWKDGTIQIYEGMEVMVLDYWRSGYFVGIINERLPKELNENQRSMLTQAAALFMAGNYDYQVIKDN